LSFYYPPDLDFALALQLKKKTVEEKDLQGAEALFPLHLRVPLRVQPARMGTGRKIGVGSPWRSTEKVERISKRLFKKKTCCLFILKYVRLLSSAGIEEVPHRSTVGRAPESDPQPESP